MSTNKPKVSIVIPVYNGANYLREAIDSALKQTYNNLEILVINDGSNDNNATEEIALSYGDKIRYFKKPNGGVASALNFGIAQMQGKYFSWLSHDDLYTEDKIEQQINVINNSIDPNIIVYSDFGLFSSSPKELQEIKLNTNNIQSFMFWLATKSSLHGCTLLIPKAAFTLVGNFDITKRTTQDYDLWFRLAEHYTFVHLPKILVKARHHAEQDTIKLNSLVIKEGDNLIQLFISKLSPEELLKNKHSLPISYAQIAGSAYNRGFFEAYKIARSLLYKNISQVSLNELPSLMTILLSNKIKFYLKLIKNNYIPRFFFR